jgi:hypothetical protein
VSAYRYVQKASTASEMLGHYTNHVLEWQLKTLNKAADEAFRSIACLGLKTV